MQAPVYHGKSWGHARKVVGHSIVIMDSFASFAVLTRVLVQYILEYEKVRESLRAQYDVDRLICTREDG